MTNRLASESSPYLLQHAENPVDWYPWGDEAFELAKREGKPVLLSIGYSACHWCHVMAHESFEDDAIAAVMNEQYINIKVDREERPDIDKLYQTAQQLITQQGGGWPLTMFLSAEDRRPFFGGTYFPNEAKYGMPAFPEILQSVATYHREQADTIREQGEQLINIFRQLDPPPADGEPDAAPLDGFRGKVAETFDRENGGTGTAPKFPQPSTIALLLRRWRATANAAEPDLDSLFMASLTLTRMAEGGVFDHVGGGFYRYSVDQYWQIPHFEKMLYDNGPLLACYAEAFLATGDELFEETANRVADWMLEAMQAGNGGFYSTLDADSEGEEGRFYVWTPDEIADALPAEQAALVTERFGLDHDANFEGRWHLTVHKDLKSLASDHKLSVKDTRSTLTDALQTLRKTRDTRVAPDLDDKQLTSWNALAIRGLAIAGRSLQREDLVDAAGRAADFIRSKAFVDGRLFASYKDNTPKFAGYLDDYAFLMDALIELLQCRWNADWLNFATELADALLDHFEDADNGGFFFTAHDHETLIHRSKPLADEALPAGNAVACFALQRLGLLLGETRYLDAADRGIRFAYRAMQDFPHGHASLLLALEDRLDYPETLIIRGDADEAARWQQAAHRLFAPRRQVFAIPQDATELPAGLKDKSAQPGETLAYRCRGLSCDAPVTTWEALAASLSEAQEPIS